MKLETAHTSAIAGYKILRVASGDAIASSHISCSIEISKHNWHTLLLAGWVIKRRKLTICPDQSKDRWRFACQWKLPWLQAVTRPTCLIMSEGRQPDGAVLGPELLSNRPYGKFQFYCFTYFVLKYIYSHVYYFALSFWYTVSSWLGCGKIYNYSYS
jgi:hypothetical protein